MSVSALPGMAISVIIPVLDEEARIGRRLEELRVLHGIAEVIVVDGGSRDRTLSIARAFQEVLLIETTRGRAAQMNAGAALATGDVLLFLHADVSLPHDTAAQVAHAFTDPSLVAGAFRTWTVCDERQVFWAPLLHIADLRSRWTRLPYGDQALFVHKSAFSRAGGFPDQPLMEDLEFARRLRRLGRMVTVPSCVRVSGRRFLSRPVASILAMSTFPLLYHLGVAPRVLARMYGNPR